MDIRKVKKLIELLEESNIDEIEIKEGEDSVRISRGGNSAGMAQMPMMAPYAAPAPAPVAMTPAPAEAPAAPAAAPAATGHVITFGWVRCCCIF